LVFRVTDDFNTPPKGGVFLCALTFILNGYRWPIACDLNLTELFSFRNETREPCVSTTIAESRSPAASGAVKMNLKTARHRPRAPRWYCARPTDTRRPRNIANRER